LSASTAQRLREASAALTAERVPLGDLLAAHGNAAHGTLLLFLAAPCVLPVPGVGSVLGLGIAAVALAMWRGQESLCLPSRVTRLEIPLHWAKRVLAFLATVHRVAGATSRSRLESIADTGQRTWIAATLGLMGVLITLPIPFGNILPAAAVTLFGLGTVFRDGAAALLGMAVAVVATLFPIALAAAAWAWGWDYLRLWLPA
jgi:hypothetical protein